MHPGHVPLSEVWGGNPWGSNDFNFHKEDLQLCRGKLVHTLDNPDVYTFAYDETPLYKPNETEGTLPIEHYVRRVVVYLGRLQSVTQNQSGGLNVRVYVKASTSMWLQMYARMYHGCGIGTCEHLPTPAMLTAAALVKTEDDLKKDENDTYASASPEVKKERTNVLLAANEIRNSLAIGGNLMLPSFELSTPSSRWTSRCMHTTRKLRSHCPKRSTTRDGDI